MSGLKKRHRTEDSAIGTSTNALLNLDPATVVNGANGNEEILRSLTSFADSLKTFVIDAQKSKDPVEIDDDDRKSPKTNPTTEQICYGCETEVDAPDDLTPCCCYKTSPEDGETTGFLLCENCILVEEFASPCDLCERPMCQDGCKFTTCREAGCGMIRCRECVTEYPYSICKCEKCLYCSECSDNKLRCVICDNLFCDGCKYNACEECGEAVCEGCQRKPSCGNPVIVCAECYEGYECEDCYYCEAKVKANETK